MNNDQWNAIDTAPVGTLVKMKHERCPGYDTTGVYLKDGTCRVSNFFIDGKMHMYVRPTHWAPLDKEGVRS